MRTKQVEQLGAANAIGADYPDEALPVERECGLRLRSRREDSAGADGPDGSGV
jgi:hypothetical protein